MPESLQTVVEQVIGTYRVRSTINVVWYEQVPGEAMAALLDAIPPGALESLEESPDSLDCRAVIRACSAPVFDVIFVSSSLSGDRVEVRGIGVDTGEVSLLEPILMPTAISDYVWTFE